MTNSNKKIAVIYLCRGADSGWEELSRRFLYSYVQHDSGAEHALYIIFKGFDNRESINKAYQLLKDISFNSIELDDDGFDIGAYIKCSNLINEDLICMLNSHSKILHKDWLLMFYLNFHLPNVNLVGATCSYESLDVYNGFPSFPNPHIRTNAFMLERRLFIDLTKTLRITNKIDAMRFESGRNSLTRMIISNGGEVLAVGKNGRGYSINLWPRSGIFKLEQQQNLLISDNQTDNYINSTWPIKSAMSKKTWNAK